jgi:uncharacterized protein YndB with AHSA1/START domain
LIKVGLSTVIDAPRARVWSALTVVDETLRWRPGLLAATDAAEDWPVVGQPFRWRCRLHDLPIELRETPLEIVRGERLRSRLRLGLFRFEETFTLTAVEEAPQRTRLGLHVHVANEMPVVGGTLDRFSVRRLATDLSAIHLQALRDWCEATRSGRAPVREPDLAPAAAR